jgi:hypothetical protein
MCCREYGLHNSQELIDLYAARPFQGQDPGQARVVIWGRDANYSCRISEHEFFREILSYHENGVRFWEERQCHHPFLLPDYPFPRNTDGVPYHRNFGSMELSPACAKHIAFVELLDVPTTGNTANGFRQLAQLRLHDGLLEYIQRLEEKLLESGRKAIFISPMVLRDLEFIRDLTGCFNNDFDYDARIEDPATFPVVYNGGNGDVEVLLAYHFSCAKFFCQREAIRTRILTATNNCN